MIEPVAAQCFDGDKCDLLARFHDRCPVWTRFELAMGAPSTKSLHIARLVNATIDDKLMLMDGTNTCAGLSVEVTREIHMESREAINRGLTQFNTQHLGGHEWIALDVYVRNPAGDVVAGLIGGAVFDRLYIYALWVAQDLRRCGLGTRILRAAEQTAADRGCRRVFLDTLSFQAPAFYEKHGYQRIAVVDFQPGVEKIYLQKRLPDKNQVGGTV